MVRYYYVKANRQEWEFPKGSGRLTDWENFPLGETQDFATFTKNQLYWKNLKKSDLIMGHSSYISSKIKDKFGKPRVKVSHRPRISAIAIVEAEEHHSKNLETDAVTLRKVIELQPLELTKEFVERSGLRALEPFRLGTNRCAITKLSEADFEKIKDLLEEENPSIKELLRKIRGNG